MGGGKSKHKQVPKKQEQEKQEPNHIATPHELLPLPPRQAGQAGESTTPGLSIPARRDARDAHVTDLDLTVFGDDLTCMTVDADGYQFVCTKSALYLICPKNGGRSGPPDSGTTHEVSGWHALLAGHKSETGYKDGNGPEARFNNPRGIALDLDHNVLLADTDNHALRKVSRTGAVTTVAGSGEGGYADGVGTAAQFHRPWGIVVDAHGTIFIADRDNHCLRKVAPADGTVSTLAGTGQAGWSAKQFNMPMGLALDADSHLIVADSGNHCIRRVTTDNGGVTKVAGKPEHPGSTDGEDWRLCALFDRPCGIAVDGDNNVLVADTNNSAIRMIKADGSSIPGNDAVAYRRYLVTTLWTLPENSTGREWLNLALDKSGRLFVLADENKGLVREMVASLVPARKGRVESNQTLLSNRGARGDTRIATLDEKDVTCIMGARGYLFVCTNSVLYLITPSGWHALLAGHKSETGCKDGNGPEARFNNPRGIALDFDHNVLLADMGNHALRKVTRTGVVTTVAGSGKGYADGVGTAAHFNSPWGIVVDAHGTIFVADKDNHCLRKVAPADGTVSTLAGKGQVKGWSNGSGESARFSWPRGLALDTDSHLIVADSGNHCIRRVTTDEGRVTTVAGRAEHPGSADGEAADALFNHPCGIAVDGNNNVLVADTKNNAIRMIAGAGGQVTTFMGNGEGGNIDGAGATVLSAEEARAIFAAIDTDKSGEITIDELRAYMRREDPSVTEEQVQRRYVYLNCIEPRNLALVPHLNDPASHQSGRLLVLEKENKGLLRDVDALLWAKENLAVDARRHALDAFSCLRSLGQAYAFVKEKRTERMRLKTGLEAHIEAFEKLIQMLRRHEANRGVGNVGMNAGKLEEQVEEWEQKVKNHHNVLGKIQKEIQEQVATCYEVGQVHVVASPALPKEVQTKLQERDVQRDEHMKSLRQGREDLLQATIQATIQVSKLDVSLATIQVSKLDVSSPEIKIKRDLDEAIKSKREQEREMLLESVLDAACKSVKEYNAKAGAERGSMGARLPTMPQQTEVIPSAVKGYDDWKSDYLENGRAERSDDAMLALQKTWEASIRKVLDLEQADAHEATGLEQAFKAAGLAISEEREHQRKDALGFFPCTALRDAGQQLLQVWEKESEAIRRAVRVCSMLDVDLKENEDCLDRSPRGPLSQNKDKLVDEVKAAQSLHDKKVLALNTLRPVIALRDKESIRQFAKPFADLQDVPANVEYVGWIESKLQQDVKKASVGLTAAIMKLTGERQHFPEVIWYVSKGLPSELGPLWRPSRSLDSFDEKKKVAENTSHPVWRVRDGETWFAIKQYPITQERPLRTRLNEAAIIYRHRQLNIVEIKALFLGTGDDSFYMQMPWYKHGSVDKWVCGNQRPGWVKVRSVLLDALIGLTHLHENGILHGDVKPPNILVDDRERGRVADFDISIDTKERTNRGATTRCATALGMTFDFAAPELKTSNQATKHTDMFAYGKTVQCLQGHCEPGAQEAFHDNARGQTAALVKDLTLDDPEKRPAAKHVIERSPFFAILHDVRIRESRVCLLCDMSGDECNKDVDAGIECSEGHFTCGSCVRESVQDLLKVENQGKRARLRGEVKCFKCPTECNAPGFTERDLARHLFVDDFQAYLKSRLEILEADLKATLEEESRRQVEEQVARLKTLDERERRVLLARKHIEEDILQPKCPRQSCRRGFFDFEGCFAISCSSCPCKFCGWCLQDCGDHDAHPHVLQCAKVPRGVDAWFPQMPTVQEAFEKTHKGRCRERIKSYIDNELEPDVREQVRQEVLRKEPGLL